ALMGGLHGMMRIVFWAVLWMVLAPIAMLAFVGLIDVMSRIIQVIAGQGSGMPHKWSVSLAAVVVGVTPTVAALAPKRLRKRLGISFMTVIVCVSAAAMAYLAAAFLWGSPGS